MALISSGALAVGVLVISLTSGVNTNVSNYMFGSILTISSSDAVLSVILCAAVLVVFTLFYPRIFAVTFDETFARATGTKAEGYNMLLAILTAVTVVLGMRMMGAELPLCDGLLGCTGGSVLHAGHVPLLCAGDAFRRERGGREYFCLRGLCALRAAAAPQVRPGSLHKANIVLRPEYPVSGALFIDF